MKPYQGISAYLSFVVLPFIVSGLIKKPRGVCQTELIQIVRTVQKSPKCRILGFSRSGGALAEHSCFRLDSLVVIKLDVSVDHLVASENVAGLRR